MIDGIQATAHLRERWPSIPVLVLKNHVTSILTKLDVRDRTQAALRARQLGLG